MKNRAAKARAIAKRLNDLADERSKWLTANDPQPGNMRLRDVVADTLSDLADIVLTLCEDADPYEAATK